MGCKHNYVFNQGYFVCTRCGRRQYGKTYKKKQGKKVALTVIIPVIALGIGVLFYSGILSINQENVDQTLQNVPEEIQEAGKTAQDLATETTIILREAIREELSEDQLKSLDKTFEEMAQIPEEIKEKTSEIQKDIEKDQIKREEQKLLEEQKYLEDITVKIHELVNGERTSRGLTPLAWNSKIALASLNHSNDMANRGYYEHDSPEGLDFTYRYSQVGFNCLIDLGYQYSLGAENLMYMEGYHGVESVARSTVDGWMNSPGHRENMLTPYYQSEGIGVARSGNEIYVTQNFC
jgi:uncharacterized protein YkwD